MGFGRRRAAGSGKRRDHCGCGRPPLCLQSGNSAFSRRHRGCGDGRTRPPSLPPDARGSRQAQEETLMTGLRPWALHRKPEICAYLSQGAEVASFAEFFLVRRKVPPFWVGARSSAILVYHHRPSPSEKSGENWTVNPPSRSFSVCTHRPCQVRSDSEWVSNRPPFQG